MKWQLYIQDLSVLDVSKLERRWLKYKIKQLFPYGLFLTAIIVLGITIPLQLFNNPTTVALVSKKKEIIKINSQPVQKHEDTVLLEPSMSFIQSMTPSSAPSAAIATINSPAVSEKSTHIFNTSTPTSPLVKEPLPKTQSPIAAKAVQPVLKGKITSIKRDDEAFDIHELEERFKNNANPNLGLYIARYHYDHGNYTESYNYALKTNAINSTLDESWLIFAKSLVKLGKEDQAKKTLQLYISNSNSQNAKNYLDILSKEPTR